MGTHPKLLRQLKTNRIYIETPAQLARADMVHLHPNEVKLTGKGYVYIKPDRAGLTMPQKEDPPAKEPDVSKDEVVEVLEQEPDVIFDKHPNNMKNEELRAFADAINERFSELALVFPPEAKRSFMVSKCSEALKAITEMQD